MTPREAKALAVKLAKDGAGYSAIADELKKAGYTSKKTGEALVASTVGYMLRAAGHRRKARYTRTAKKASPAALPKNTSASKTLDNVRKILSLKLDPQEVLSLAQMICGV